jgi:hypothetical protein
MVLEECPFCHRLLAAEKISKEQVDSNTQGLLKDPRTFESGVKVLPAGRRNIPVPDIFAPSPVQYFITYKILYRCKHCGKEWTKTSTEENEIARSDAGVEQASSADVAREAEWAKEEEHE